MSFSTKAIFAAFVLSLTPALVSAQTYTYPIAPGSGGPYINGNLIPGTGHGGVPIRPGQAIIGTPVQTHDCGAAQYQYLVGYHHSTQPMPSHAAVVYPGTIRTTQYIATRLNVSVDQNGYVARVYCG